MEKYQNRAHLRGYKVDLVEKLGEEKVGGPSPSLSPRSLQKRKGPL
jgi:hypothetical protein